MAIACGYTAFKKYNALKGADLILEGNITLKKNYTKITHSSIPISYLLNQKKVLFGDRITFWKLEKEKE